MSIEDTPSAAATRTQAAPVALPRWQRYHRFSQLVGGTQGPLIGLSSNVFLSLRNALNVIDQVTTFGILALGMTGVIIIGGIDLSVGSILALSIMVLGWLPQDYGIPFWLGLVLCIVAGGACGLVNGLLVTRARLPAFIATLTMMSVVRGLANITTDGQQILDTARPGAACTRSAAARKWLASPASRCASLRSWSAQSAENGDRALGGA